MRGLCPNSAIDVNYKPVNKQNDIRYIKFLGLKGASIEYVEKDNTWALIVTNTKVTGKSPASFASFTLGRHNWTIRGDKGCSLDEVYTKELKMSACPDGEITCNDGQCVKMDQRCNQLGAVHK